MTARPPILLNRCHGDREERDWLELLTALINGPGFDPLFRGEVICVPPRHAVYPWCCAVADCERPRAQKADWCTVHAGQWREARSEGMDKATFAGTATPLRPAHQRGPARCRVCPGRPSAGPLLGLCRRHSTAWRIHRSGCGLGPGFDEWLAAQSPYAGYGECRVSACGELASGPLQLCDPHLRRYASAGRPGGAGLPERWFNTCENSGYRVPVRYADEAAFRCWCATERPVPRTGEINLRGLPPLLRAEIKWGLHAHGQGTQRRTWEVPWIQAVAAWCRREQVASLMGVDPVRIAGEYRQLIVREIRSELNLIHLTPAAMRDAGFIETEHFGVRFRGRSSRFDFTKVPQRWLRELLWDFTAERLQSPGCPRSGNWLDQLRKFCIEFGTFLQQQAPHAGHDPTVLQAAHVQRFTAEIRRRERLRLPALTAPGRVNGPRGAVTPATRRKLFNAGRQLLRSTLENGEITRLGLDRGFVTAMPPGGHAVQRTRSPFPDQVARALADEANLRHLASSYDIHDRGLRDMWETIVATGRRASEVVNLRLDCLGRYNGLPMLWHDQTKVGNYDQAIRIPEPVYQRLCQRQRTTLARFADRNGGRQPTSQERATMALFPSRQRNRDGARPVSAVWFGSRFRQWVDGLQLGRCVPHQARHTLATRLLAHGATLEHVRRYLGHLSIRMAEQYVKVAVSEIDDILQLVWVAGPGAANPGELLSSPAAPLGRQQAEALAVDLSRRSTPTEGGFCTFQPVVNGAICPWKLNCEGCDKFVLSGADLLYWRRKREQWNSIAERAPDDATADYLHKVFEPTARAIDGLEKALAGLGLLDDALALDLRRPQDYFQRLWNTGFRVTDLADAAADIEKPGGLEAIA